jgi:hypothetical protein
MAEIAVGRKDPLIERTGFRLSWGAIFAGMLVATALHMVFALIGLAVGFGAWDPGDRIDTLGAGLGIWIVTSGIVSLFVGGLVTGRLAGVLTRGDGALHGVVLWALASLFTAYLVMSGLGMVLGGAFNVLGRTAAAAVGGVGQIGAAAVGQAGGLDLGMLQQEVERTLEQTRAPGLQPDTLRAEAERVGERATGPADNQAVARDVVETIRQRGGQVDREAIVNVLTARTEMDRAEADRVAQRVENLAQSAYGQAAVMVDTIGERAEHAAGRASGVLAQAALWTLLTLGLSLGAAVLGARMKATE